MAQQTQITGSSPDTDTSTVETEGSEELQPTDDTQVEDETVEDKDNSGSSDESNGTDSKPEERQRPVRAERRIAKLTADLKAATDALEVEKRLRAQLDSPIDNSNIALPDYSQQDQVTPDQLKKDIINAADQIVRLRLEQGFVENNRVVTQKQLTNQALADIAEAQQRPQLNPDSEDYDPELEQFLVETFDRAYKGDPNYRFKDLVDTTLKNWSKSKPNKTSDKTKQAIKPYVSKRAQKAIADMSADEYLEYLRNKV